MEFLKWTLSELAYSLLDNAAKAYRVRSSGRALAKTMRQL